MTETTQQAHIYQAIGVVKGILDITAQTDTLNVGGIDFPAIVKQQVRKKLQPEQIQHFRVYPGLRMGHLIFNVVAVVDTSPTLFRLKGCWELYQDEPYLVIYRNLIPKPSYNQLRNLVSVQWQDAPPTDGQFWELEAALEGEQLVVTKVEGPYDPPPKVTKAHFSIKVPTEKSQHQANAKPRQTQPTATPLTSEEIRKMATPVKAQLTCKLNEVPAHRTLPDKKIEFFLRDESDRIFTVRVKPKMFKKLTDHGYEHWVAAITGTLGPATETGFELVNPVVQVFEKKAPVDAAAGQKKSPSKGSKPPSEKTAATTVAKPQKLKAEANNASESKGKSLLDGVRLG